MHNTGAVALHGDGYWPNPSPPHPQPGHPPTNDQQQLAEPV